MIFKHVLGEKQGVGLLGMGLSAIRDRTMYLSFSTGQVCFSAPVPGVTTRSTTQGGQHIVAGPEAVLTVDVLTRMTTFWASFVKEPDSVQVRGRRSIHEWMVVTDGQQQGQVKAINMAAMAAKYPSIATDFKQAGLVPQQWEDYRRAIFDALLAPSSTPATSVLGQNVAFLGAHQQEFDALKAAGERFPPPRQQGNDGDDLSP